MVKSFFILLYIISSPVFGQYDTSLIARAISYVGSESFKSEFIKFVERDILNESSGISDKKSNRKYDRMKKAQIDFWLSNDCFISDSVYFIPVIDKRRLFIHDSLLFSKFDTVPYLQLSSSCKKEVVLEPYFLSPNIIELRFFKGIRSNSKWVGESNRLRLDMKGIKPEILHQDFIFHN
jgi:hypothetical protein